LFDGKLRRHRLLGIGLGLCLLGLVKKVMLADSIGPIADTVFRDGPAMRPSHGLAFGCSRFRSTSIFPGIPT
jgi:hypothetical protein